MGMSSYLAEPGRSLTKFAAEVGISVGFAHDLLRGRRKPSALMALRIEEVTGIPREDMRPDLYPPGSVVRSGRDVA